MDALIKISWDEEAKVYTACCEEIGLFLESETFDTLKKRVIVAAPEIAKENNIAINTLLLKLEQSVIVSA